MNRRHNLRVPDWAKDAIWYQIFPERFRNGSRRNDPRLGDFTDHAVPGWRIMPWGSDWYALDRWERPAGSFWKTVYLRRYGGDLVGVRQKLGYLQDLGVNAIYLNPVFQALSLHKYDASCLHHVDPAFGPDRAGDLRAIATAKETEDPATWIWTKGDRYLLELVRDAHARGMRVILDGVFNHAGRAFFAFRDLLARGRQSRYRDWFLIKTWNDDGSFEYDGWFGHKALPEFARTENDLAAPVREYIFDITRRWMSPDGDRAGGIDGWRLDVAFCVPHGFWRKWRRLVKRLNPEAYLTAEIVNRADDYLRGDEFDAVMNYMWLYPTLNFFAPHMEGIGVRRFRREQDALRKAYPEESLYVLQNLLDSHDVGRIASMLENVRAPIEEFQKYFEASRAHDRPAFATGKPGAKTYQALRQAIVFQMTYLGAPMLYYGTEVGMWGGNDPCDRQPMLWEDVSYDAERQGPRGPCRRARRAPDLELLAFTRKAIALRKAHVALRRGTLRWLHTGNERLLGFERRCDEQRIVVLLNASDQAAGYAMKKPSRDAWTDRSVSSGRVAVPPRSWRVLAV